MCLSFLQEPPELIKQFLDSYPTSWEHRLGQKLNVKLLTCIIVQFKFACQSVSQSVNSIVLLRGDKRKNKGFRDGERHCGLDPDIQESVAWPSVNNSCPFQLKCKSSQVRTLIQTTHTQLTCAEAQVYNHDNIEHAVKGILTKPAKILRQGFF